MFKKLLDKFLCRHAWYEYKKLRLYDEDDSMPSGHLYILMCKKCGKIKKVET